MALTVLDSVNKVNKKYLRQTLLEECKYQIKKNKMKNFLNNDLCLSSSDNESDNESKSEPDNGTDNDENCDYILIITKG